MFENFPKQRSVLPEAYQKIYADHYKKNRDGATAATSVSNKMEEWLHKKAAADLQGKNDKATLEIGAGTLNQLQYEDTAPYDIIEPFKSLFEGNPLLAKVRNIYNDIDEIELKPQYDRITAIATFEHVTDLPKVVAKSCLMMNEGGSLRISIPNEGTILWKLGYTLTTGIEFWLKHKLPYHILMNHEHVNKASEVEEVLKYFYDDCKCSCFGVSKGLAFYRFYECKQPHITRANEYLKTYKGSVNK